MTVLSRGAGAPVAIPIAAANVAVGVGITSGGAILSSNSLDNLKNDLGKLQESKGNAEAAKKPTSQSQLQNQVKKGQAPKGINRVDPADSNIPGSKSHIHFGENEASLNSDGTWHDAGKPHPIINNKVEKWILDNGWKLPTQ